MTKTDRPLAWGAAAFLLLGIAVRLWHVFSEPLWLDEAYSAYAADHDFAFLWHVVPRYETHPPFYYSLLRLWVLLFGDGLVALRLPGVIAGLATLALMAVAARAAATLLGWDKRRRWWVLLAALALAAVSTPLVEMTRQVRPYPLMILVYAAALVLLLRLRAAAAERQPIGGRAYLAYLLLLEALLWLHNMGPLFGVAATLTLAVAVLGRTLSRADWAWLIGGHLAVAVAYLPGLHILLGQAPTWASSTWVRLRPDEVFGRIQMLYAVTGFPALAALALAASAVLACRRSPGGGRLAAMLLLLSVVPVALSLLLSVTIAPVFIARTMTPVAVPGLLLCAIGAAGMAGLWRWAGFGGVLMISMSMGAVDIETRLGGPMQDWVGTVAWLQRWARPGDAVLAYPNEGALPLAYALRDGGPAIPIRPIPAPVPAFADYGGWYPTGSRGVVSLPPARLRAIAADPATQAVPTIWLLRLGRETYDRGDIFLAALHRGRVIVRRWQSGPIEIVGLRRLAPAPGVLRSPPAPARNPR